MRALLDTHALIWWLLDAPELSEASRELIADRDHEILVSAASGWEIATKHRLGKLAEAEAVAEDLAALVRRAQLDVLPISLEHAIAAGRLPGPHKDPFDRMLIAQARTENLSVVTTDPVFAAYGVQVIW